MMKQFAEPGRPHDWINQKTCAAQYNLLEERFDIKRPKRGEKIEAGSSPMEMIVKKLSDERIAELGDNCQCLNISINNICREDS